MRFLQGHATRLALAFCLFVSQAHAGSMTLLDVGSAPGGFTPSCSQSSTWLARTSGLSGTEQSAYDTMICGMVSDGTWTLLDSLYLFATNTTTTANLNLVSTSFSPLTQTGTVSFSADQGYTGNGTTGFLHTGYTESTAAGNLTLNSASMGGCVLNSRASANNSVIIGVAQTGANNYLQPLEGANLVAYHVTGANSSFPTAANTNAQGSWIISRTGASAGALYHNGTSFVSYTATSGSLATVEAYILAINNNGTAGSFSSDQTAYAFIGGGLNATQAGNIRSRLNTYLTAVGASGC